MRGSSWIKIVLFVLAAFMLAGIAQVLLDPGLGVPEESRRAHHPAGFSFIPPRGWGVTTYFADRTDQNSTFRIAPEKSVGRQPAIGVARSHKPATPEANTVRIEFQGRPAFRTVTRGSRDWHWRLDFERDGVWYWINATYPTPVEIENGPLWKFMESFRVEPVLNLTTLPTSLPVEGVSP